MLYDNKASTNLTAKEGIQIGREEREESGYHGGVGRGGFRKGKNNNENSNS